jgi:glycosyltransferase involved in cell wall biosynthesis
MKRIRVVVPVYNDWTSFRMLLDGLDKEAATLPFRLFVSAVNDGSTESADAALGDLTNLQCLQGAEIIHLLTNLGHQRAIAIGLCVVVEDDNFDAVLIMDADGEDSPETIQHLTRGIGDQKDFCVVARRRRREETLTFKLGYQLYKLTFKAVTGKAINYGNFSILSKCYAQRLVMISDLWNNLPAAILRSRLPTTSVSIDRCSRYAGTSKMNFTSLIVHGLSSLSVYADTIFVRLLVLSVGIFLFSLLAVPVLLIMRLIFPAHATPGWATTITFCLAIIILQVFLTALSSILMLLHNRVQRLVVPKLDYRPYISSRQRLFSSTPTENFS